MTLCKLSVSGRTVIPLLFLSACLFYVPAHAVIEDGSSTENTVTVDNSAGAAPREITEIIINAERPARLVLEEAYEAQEIAFSIFNDLNSNDEFDITCGNYTPTGTRIAQRRCEPRYFVNAQAQASQDLLLGLRVDPPTDNYIWMEVAPKTEQLNVEMKELALEHPQLAESLLLYNRKMQEYDKLIKARGWLYQLLHQDD